MQHFVRFTSMSFLMICLVLESPNIRAQIPTSGTYRYSVAFAEWGGKSLGSTVIVVISGDSIKIINDGSMSGEKGKIIDQGRIVKHKSGKWIIARKREDEFADEVGGCSEGPSEIDFKNKKWWTC